MVLRIALLALMALGLAGFGTVAWISSRPPPRPVAAAAAQTPILVAAHPLRAGSLLQPADIGAKRTAAVPPGAPIDSPAARAGLLGAMVRHSLPAGTPLMPGDVIRPGDHGFLAAVLRPGMRAVTVGVDLISGTAGLIWPGDRIDLILTQMIARAGQPLGRRIAGERVLADARVVAIDQHMMQGAVAGGAASLPARTITLEVTPNQAERVAVATHLGQLSLVLRAAGHGVRPQPQRSPKPGIVWGQDVSPALSARPPAATAPVVRVFQGADNAQEFKF